MPIAVEPEPASEACNGIEMAGNYTLGFIATLSSSGH